MKQLRYLSYLFICSMVFSTFSCGGDDDEDVNPLDGEVTLSDLRGEYYLDGADFNFEITNISESSATLVIPELGLNNGRLTNFTITATVTTSDAGYTLTIENGQTVDGDAFSGTITYNNSNGEVTYNINYAGQSYSGIAVNITNGVGIGAGGSCNAQRVSALTSGIMTAANQLLGTISSGTVTNLDAFYAAYKNYLDKVINFYTLLKDACPDANPNGQLDTLIQQLQQIRDQIP